MSEPKLLRIPTTFHSVDDVLETAKKLKLPNVVLLSEMSDGRLVFLDSGLNFAEANWLLDRMKTLLLVPSAHRMTE